jgi:hypothetical protein
MVVSERRSLIEGIVGATFHLPIHIVLGETLDLGLPDQTMVEFCVALPLEGIILGTFVGWWRQEVKLCSSVSITPSLGGMA